MHVRCASHHGDHRHQDRRQAGHRRGQQADDRKPAQIADAHRHPADAADQAASTATMGTNHVVIAEQQRADRDGTAVISSCQPVSTVAGTSTRPALQDQRADRPNRRRPAMPSANPAVPGRRPRSCFHIKQRHRRGAQSDVPTACRTVRRSPSTAQAINADHSGIVKPSTADWPEGMRHRPNRYWRCSTPPSRRSVGDDDGAPVTRRATTSDWPRKPRDDQQRGTAPRTPTPRERSLRPRPRAWPARGTAASWCPTPAVRISGCQQHQRAAGNVLLRPPIGPASRARAGCGYRARSRSTRWRGIEAQRPLHPRRGQPLNSIGRLARRDALRSPAIAQAQPGDAPVQRIVRRQNCAARWRACSISATRCMRLQKRRWRSRGPERVRASPRGGQRLRALPVVTVACARRGTGRRAGRASPSSTTAGRRPAGAAYSDR
mgnify:CR=1 FL=1